LRGEKSLKKKRKTSLARLRDEPFGLEQVV
jgi:hypothetical protein